MAASNIDNLPRKLYLSTVLCISILFTVITDFRLRLRETYNKFIVIASRVQ